MYAAIYDSQFVSNIILYPKEYGGAAITSKGGSNLVIKNSLFDNNTLSGYGGDNTVSIVISVYENSTLSSKNCIFSNNINL